MISLFKYPIYILLYKKLNINLITLSKKEFILYKRELQSID